MPRYTDWFKSPRSFRFMMNLWPPLLCQGISIDTISADFRRIQVSLTLRWYNRNNFGTLFGGSLSAMTDAFHSITILKNLGPGYQVWDQSASIDFVRPARGKVTVEFLLSSEQLETILLETAERVVSRPVFHVKIVNQAGISVAEVRRQVYVRRLSVRVTPKSGGGA